MFPLRVRRKRLWLLVLQGAIKKCMGRINSGEEGLVGGVEPTGALTARAREESSVFVERLPEEARSLSDFHIFSQPTCSKTT